MRPNLFDYAMTELSQDAVICWLLAWADRHCAVDDAALHAVGHSIVSKLLQLHNVPYGQSVGVTVHRQLLRADIVAEVGTEFVLLIEDKVHAGLHGDQLDRYVRDIAERFKGKRVLPVFLKTGDQSSYKDAEEAGYKLFVRHQLLELLRPWRDKVSNAIFSDFLKNLEWRESQIGSFSTKLVSDWTQEWDPWIGFYKRLQRSSPMTLRGTTFQMHRAGFWAHGGISMPGGMLKPVASTTCICRSSRGDCVSKFL